MKTVFYGQFVALGIAVLKYVALYYVVKYAVKAALKEDRM